MRFEEFIDRVQERTKLDTRAGAIRITKAVLETLGERLDRKVRNGVEAQLPTELKDFLLARGEVTQRYDVHSFYDRVGARADLTRESAVEHTRQVLSVLQEVIPPAEIRHMLESLPGEYRVAFGAEQLNR